MDAGSHFLECFFVEPLCCATFVVETFSVFFFHLIVSRLQITTEIPFQSYCSHLDLITIHSHLLTLTSGLPQVFKHERLGQSRDEFLELNAPRLSICSHAIVILSDTASSSLFVYNEVLLADWLGKSFVVVMVTNSWDNLRPNMQAILGICPAVDFECRPFEESMEILLYHLKPFRNMPAVILEQEFLDRMKEGLRPLRVLAAYHGKLCQSK